MKARVKKDKPTNNEKSIFAECEPRKYSDKFAQATSKKKPLFKKHTSVIPGSITRDMLSDEQKSALEKMESFCYSAERQMVFAGFAGTGKSLTTRFLLDFLDGTTLKSVCTAPTNEAVRVISKQSGRAYSMTIYSLLGLALRQDDDSSPYLQVVGECKLKDYDIVVIDECSMINSNLYIMIEAMLKQFSHVKIIYVGDPAQLPPVNDPNGISPTFSINPDNWSFLKEVQRTAKENPIISVVTQIRENLTSSEDVFEKKTVINEDKGVGIEFLTDRDEFMNRMYSLFQSKEFKDDPNFVRSLAYTNHAVNAMNSFIRRAIYGKAVQEFIEDEIVLVDEPIMDKGGFSVDYTTGERLRIESAELCDDVNLGIKYWSLDVVNYEAPSASRVSRQIEVVHQNYIVQYRELLTKAAQKSKQMVIQLGSKRDAWKPFFALKNRFSKIKYIYAITVHTSQGSTFKNVFVVNADMDKLRWNHVERNKLKYVAFTRASNNLIIY